MIDKEQVLQAVKMKGLVVPSDITREFHTDTFIIGAVLSDLVHDKKLLVSTVKKGGSPVYYSPEHKERLLDLYKYLNEKDRQTFEMLKKEKVVSDAEQIPLIRVSLRNLKDYAKPIEVTVNGKTSLFWKWYLATEQEIHELLHTHLSEQQIQPQQTVLQKAIEKQPLQQVEKQVHPKIKEASKITKDIKEEHESFIEKVKDFFHQKEIVIMESTLIKKGEMEYLIKVPSAVGNIVYFCKAKQKKKCSEGDIATTFVAAQLKKLPALFLTTGEVPKKLLQKIPEEYPNMKIINF